MPYVGQLGEIPAGVGTLVSDNNAARTRYLDLIVAEGIVSEKGVWEREPGATPYFATGLAAGAEATATIATAQNWTIQGAAYESQGSISHLVEFNGTAANVASTAHGLGGSSSFFPTIPSGATMFASILIQGSAQVLTAVDPSGHLTWTFVGRQVGADTVLEVWSARVTTSFAQPASLVTFTINSSARAITHGNLFSGVGDFIQGIGANGTGTAVASSVTSAIEVQEAFVYAAIGTRSSATITAGTGFTLVGQHALPVAPTMNTGAEWQTFTAADHSTLPNAIVDYWVDTTTQRLLVLGADGRLYKSSGGEFLALTMASTMEDDYGSQIIVGGQETAGAPRKAFVFDHGHTRIQTLSGDGTTTTDFGNGWNTTTNIPLDWATNPPRGAVMHKERLWPFAPANAPHNIYASKLRDHENFKNAVGGSLEYVQEIGTGTGIIIAAACSFKGMLFVFKYPRGIWYLDDTDVDYLNWRWNLVSDAVGVADSPHSVLVLDDDVLFMDPNGHIHFLSAVTQQGVTTSDMTAAYNLTQWTRENVNLPRLNQLASTWYPSKKLAILGMPGTAHTDNSLRIFIDFSNATEEGQVARVSYSFRDVNRVLAVRRDEVDGIQKPLFGDDDGIIWKMDQSNKTKTGVPNAGQARYQYSPTDFSHMDGALANKRKLFDALTINFNPTGNWSLGVDVIIDGDYHETLYFFMGGGQSVLGTFRFGETLGGDSIKTLRRRMTGHGYWLSIAGFVQGEGHDFSVAKHLVNFRVGGEEQR